MDIQQTVLVCLKYHNRVGILLLYKHKVKNQVFLPSQVATQTYPYAQILVDSIAANDSCTEPVFFMTWGRKKWRY